MAAIQKLHGRDVSLSTCAPLDQKDGATELSAHLRDLSRGVGALASPGQSQCPNVPSPLNESCEKTAELIGHMRSMSMVQLKGTEVNIPEYVKSMGNPKASSTLLDDAV